MNIFFLYLKSISDSVASKPSVFVAVLFPLLRKSCFDFHIKIYLKIIRKKEIIIKQGGKNKITTLCCVKET